MRTTTTAPTSSAGRGPDHRDVKPGNILIEETLADLIAWKAERVAQGGRDANPFICSVQAHRRGLPLQRHALRRRFLTGCKALTIHHGRHTFISHALAGGRTLAEVRDAAGHSSVLVTSAYLHVAVEDEGAVGDLFSVG